MSTNATEAVTATKRLLVSVDTWAVLVALALALLVRAGVLKHIPW